MDDSTVERLLDEASSLMYGENWDLSRKIYEEILQYRPNNVLAMHNLAVILSKQGEYEMSEKIFRNLLDQDSENSTSWFNYAKLLSLMNRYSDAITAFKNGLRIMPTRVDYWIELGRLHKILNQVSEAELAYQNANEFRPTAVAYLRLGNLYSEQERFEEAERAYEQALVDRPNTADLLTRYFSSMQFAGKDESTAFDFLLSTYQRLSDLGSDKYLVWYNLANARMMQSKYKEAETALRESLKLEPKFGPTWSMLTVVLTNLGRTSEANEAFRMSMKYIGKDLGR